MLIREALHALGRTWRPIYGFTLAVAVLTTLVGGGIVAAGFLVSWGDFEDARSDAEYSIASEDSYTAYADQMDSLRDVGAVVTVLLLIVAFVVLAVLRAAYAVAFERALDDDDDDYDRESIGGVGELWAHTRPRIGGALRVQGLIWLLAGGTAFLGFVLWAAVEVGAVPGVEVTNVGETATMQYRIVGWSLPIAIAGLGLLVCLRLSVAADTLVAKNTSSRVAVRRSWVLTRRARWKTFRIGLPLTAAVVLVFFLLRYAAAPVAHLLGLGMLRISGDNVWVTGVLVLITPTAVALLLLPLAILPPVYSVIAVLHRDLRALRPKTAPQQSR
ncbi:hypothetical protein [Streptomyces sp. NPDC050704]|uniref:hypothetical protein n=1 Tax=Streptomyces sp. NPDC050704 TaxID=3157219 RepID=UPI00341277E2